MKKRIGSTVILDEPLEWSDDSSLAVFADAIDAEEATDTESSTARSRRKFVNRNRWAASERLHRDYFCEKPKYDEEFFEDRYRMPKHLFLKILVTGNPPDEYDEYLEMEQRTSRECLQYFCDAIVQTYSSEYLRRPTTHDILRLFEAQEKRHHLPGMFGSLDCTHLA
uniref:uncharacterized protein LOC122602966 n=1 Tax=Erigeron canadensis TaxID=72917 RepID=UPI001CB9A69B|nr:uncharacterized protein LOC122602966 [Erigeron canadensis]